MAEAIAANPPGNALHIAMYVALIMTSPTLVHALLWFTDTGFIVTLEIEQLVTGDPTLSCCFYATGVVSFTGPVGSGDTAFSFPLVD